MAQRNTAIRCSSCGLELVVPQGGKVRTTIVGTSGKPNMLVLSVDGEELHRCESETQINLSDDETQAQMR